jgi:DNA (cytosine-5)-methyltransferase 1
MLLPEALSESEKDLAHAALSNGDLADLWEARARGLSLSARLGRRPRLLDGFCKAGGAARGYADAGFEIIGVDIEPQPNYPFAFIQADVLNLDPRFLAAFDAVHFSPPCQRYSDLAKRNGNGEAHPDLVAPVRALAQATNRPYVIENVEGAPLVDPVMLCGTMFAGLRVLRHRLFEANWPLMGRHHGKHPLVFTHDKRKGHFGKLDEMTDFVQVTGGGNCSKAAAAQAMGIDWMTKDELNQAIPPVYTRWIGRQLIRHIDTAILECAA